MIAEEGESFLPGVSRLCFSISFRIVEVLESVSGAVIAMEIMAHAVGVQGRLIVVHILRGWALVLVSENPQHRATDIARQRYRSRRSVCEG
jgi:hypothetical protein